MTYQVPMPDIKYRGTVSSITYQVPISDITCQV